MPHPIRRYFGYKAGRANYLTHVSRRHHAVFVEVPKAGCTVVKRLLQASEAPDRPPPTSPHDRAQSPLAAPVRDGLDADELFAPGSDWLRFTFVRNPYSRALSCYLEKIAGQQWLRDLRLPQLGFDPHAEVSFVEFLRRVAQQPDGEKDIHWAPQAHLLGWGRIDYNFVGRFESFATDIGKLVAVLGMEAPVELVQRRSVHTTNAVDQMATYYDDDCAALVTEIYRADFAALGYGTDPRFA